MSPSLRRPLSAVLLGAAVYAAAPLAAGPAAAESAPPYAALLAQARGASPRLAAAQAGADQARGLALQAAVRPNPVLGLEVENLTGSGPYSGLDLAETTASLSQTLELGGKRAARMAAGQADVRAAEARAGAERSAFAADLALAYAEAEAALARVIQAEEQWKAAETDARAVAELVAAGREAQLRGLQAQAEQAAARAERDEAQASADAAFARLSALAGVSVVYDAVGESLLARSAPMPNAAEAETPALAVARAERDAADARRAVQRGLSVPDVTVSAGLRRLAGDDATALVAGISLPLPLFDRNRGARAAAEAELTASQARLRQAQFDAAADLRAARAQARAAEGRAEAAGSAETAAAEAYRLARIGYEAGRLPLLELSSARRALAAARIRTLDARLAKARAEIDIARLTGRAPFGG